MRRYFWRTRRSLANRLAQWAREIVDGKNTKYKWQIIGGDADPYMVRWTIYRNRFLKVYVHLFLRPDSDEALHDHPAHNLSFILDGGYDEWLPARWHPNPPLEFVGSGLVHHDYWPINRELIWKRRLPGDLVFRRAAMPHRIELHPGLKSEGKYRKAISLFFMTGNVREWGFHCPHGWRHWKDYTNFQRQGHSGTVGKGCGD